MVRIRPNGTLGAGDGLVWEKNSNDTYGANTLFEGDNGAVTAALSGQGTRSTSKNLNTLVYQQSQILAYENGLLDETLNTVSAGSVPVGNVTLVDQLWIGQNFDDNNRPFNGTMSEVIVYFTDQSDNRTAFEANIGETYGIDLPSGVDTGYDQVDGFVETWYDQSGNGNDAVQETAGNQPKIVDAGVLVTGGIDFDGVDDFLPVPLTGHNIGNLSSFCVGKFDNASGNSDVMLSLGTGAGDSRWYGPWANTSNIRYGYGSTADAIAEFAASTDVKVHTLIAGTTIGNASGFENGTLKGTATRSTATAAGTFGIGGVADATSFPLDGKVQEVIIYESDQSDKRQAIEENIGSNYGITLTSSKDGTVSTWYDQSGNANHATQGTNANQPKIVDAGSLVTDANGKPEMDFDGVNDWFTLGVSQLGNTEFFADSSDSWFVTGVATYDYGTLISKSGNPGPAREFQIFYFEGTNSTYTRGSRTNLSSDVNQRLVSYNWDGANAVVGLNGTLNAVSVGTASKTSQDINIGARTDGQFLLNGSLQEIIIYDSDQSANRVAIEDNINNQYDIY